MSSASIRDLEAGYLLTDPITGLPKPAVQFEHLTLALQRARATGTQVAVVVLDIDDFGRIDKELGWGAGDDVLRQVGQRLRTVLRDDDMVVRLGGDQFAIVCEALTGPGDLANVMDRVDRELRTPLEVDGRPIGLVISIGSAISDGTTGPRSLFLDAEGALRQARSADERGAVVRATK